MCEVLIFVPILRCAHAIGFIHYMNPSQFFPLSRLTSIPPFLHFRSFNKSMYKLQQIAKRIQIHLMYNAPISQRSQSHPERVNKHRYFNLVLRPLFHPLILPRPPNMCHRSLPGHASQTRPVPPIRIPPRQQYQHNS